MGINFRSNTRISNVRIGPLSGGGGGVNLPINTTNLLMYYDVGSTSSYSGTGNTINDLSGNNITGTLNNDLTSPNITYSSAGEASYLNASSLDPNGSPAQGLGIWPDLTGDWYTSLVGQQVEFSTSMWVNISTSKLHVFQIFENFQHQGSSKWFYPGYFPYGSSYRRRLYIEGGWLNNNNMDNSLSSSVIPSGTWINIGYSMSSSTRQFKWYVNGTPNGSFTMSVTANSITYGNGFKIRPLGRVVSDNDPVARAGLGGLFNNFAFYTRVLSDSEFADNYNALSSRF